MENKKTLTFLNYAAILSIFFFSGGGTFMNAAVQCGHAHTAREESCDHVERALLPGCHPGRAHSGESLFHERYVYP